MVARWSRNMFRPKATPTTQKVIDSTGAFAYQSAPEFLAMDAGDRDASNVNYSPASMWMALFIVAQGANGTTRSQLNELLGSGSLTDSDYQSLLSSINGRYSGSKSEMSAANSLWIDDGYSLASDYQSTVKQTFEAEVTTQTTPTSPKWSTPVRTAGTCISARFCKARASR